MLLFSRKTHFSLQHERYKICCLILRKMKTCSQSNRENLKLKKDLQIYRLKTFNWTYMHTSKCMYLLLSVWIIQISQNEHTHAAGTRWRCSILPAPQEVSRLALSSRWYGVPPKFNTLLIPSSTDYHWLYLYFLNWTMSHIHCKNRHELYFLSQHIVYKNY